MSGWMRDAWEGWLKWNTQGKLMALFLAALLLLWFGSRKVRRGAARKLLVYASVLTGFGICPVTAALLMRYQTRFYDYVWIWSLVPITIMTAYGGVVFYTMLAESVRGKVPPASYRAKIRMAAVLLFVATVVLLGSNPGSAAWDVDAARQEKVQAQRVISILEEGTSAEQICLWAPREILEYARALDGNIRLIYGRNMWDKALGAYSYDIYSYKQELLYLWMEQTAGKEVPESTVSEEAVAKLDDADGITCISLARELGADTILLPGQMPAEELAGIKEYFGQQITDTKELEGYYLLCF